MIFGVASGPHGPSAPTNLNRTPRDECAAGEQVGSGSGVPDHTEFVEPQPVGQGAHVCRPIPESAARLERRTSISGAVDRDQPKAPASRGVVGEGALQPRAGCAVEVERGIAGGIAPFQVGQRAPVGQGEHVSLVGAYALRQH